MPTPDFDLAIKVHARVRLFFRLHGTVRGCIHHENSQSGPILAQRAGCCQSRKARNERLNSSCKDKVAVVHSLPELRSQLPNPEECFSGEVALSDGLSKCRTRTQYYEIDLDNSSIRSSRCALSELLPANTRYLQGLAESLNRGKIWGK